MVARERLSWISILLGLLVLLSLAGRPVYAGPPTGEPGPDRLRLIWRPASVVWPLLPIATDEPDRSLVALDQRLRMLEGRAPAPSVRGVVELDHDRAVGVWIAALETVRVRQIDGHEAPLRFVRSVDGHAAVLEPGRALADGPGGEPRWELTSPPGSGALWSIEAEAPTRVFIERIGPRSPRYVAVELETDLFEWIVAGGELPPLLEPAEALADQLRFDAAVANELRRIGGLERSLAQAIQAWRMLGAMAALDRERPAVRPYFARSRPLALADTRGTRIDALDSRDYRLAERPRRWLVTRKGPGQLHLAARTWAPVGEALRGAELRVLVGGRVLERIPLSPRRARRAIDPDTALPRFELLATAAGEPVGELVERTIVLAPGEHEYTLELIGGPALLSIDGARRIEATAASIRGLTPRKRARAAARALARSDSSARIWLELLLAERTHAPTSLAPEDPRLLELGRQSPLLAAACLLILAGDQHLDAERFADLVARALPWLGALDRDRSMDPAVRGQLRARWLELAAFHRRPDLADPLVRGAGNDAITELPVAGLRTLAELSTRARLRSPALALLELARRRAPADEQLRGQILQLWSEASRWSRRRPLPLGTGDSLSIKTNEWLVPRETEPADEDELARAWVRVEPGSPTRIVAELADPQVELVSRHRADRVSGRLRLIDLHIATPPDRREPVRLRVDDRRWWSPSLVAVSRHRVALTPGVHEIEIEGPPGTLAWVGAPLHESDPPLDRLYRSERMWPLDRSVWALPGPAVPGFVRLELRWPEDLPARPVRIRVLEDGDEQTRVIWFDPRASAIDPRLEIDPSAVPIEGSARASPRHDIVLPIAAATTLLRFEVEDELPIAASLSLRRGAASDDELDSPAIDSAELASPVLELDDLPLLDHEGALAELAALSRQLLDDPEDLESRARRAALLLLLGETGHARADLLRIAALAEREDHLSDRARVLIDALVQRFDALTDSREVVVADPQAPESPTLIEPALAAVIGDDEALLAAWLDRWLELRASPLEHAIARAETLTHEQPGLLAELTHAQLLARDPTRAREAARAWLRLYGSLPGLLARARQPIAVGLAAVPVLLAHLEDPRSDARDAGLAYGLARELEPAYGHPSVRRLGFVAGMRSDWTRLDHAQDSAGFERLELPIAERRPTPETEIRQALLVAPWPEHEAELLLPDRLGTLIWDATPGTVNVRLWCRAARPDLALARPSEAALLSIRLRGPGRSAQELERTLELGDAKLGIVELPIDHAGRHQLEVSLADDPIWQCSWTTTTSSANHAEQLVEARRRALWWTAESQRGVELIVLGPASLDLELRGVAGTDVTAVLASVEPLDATANAQHGRLALDDHGERAVSTESRRRFEVSFAAEHILLLTEPGPQRIRLVTDRGRALVRARLRRDRGDVAPPDRPSIHQLAPPEPSIADPLDWRELGPGPELVARDAVTPIRNRIGTLELQARAGLDQIGDVDDLRPRLGMVASLGWRRALIDNLLWLAISAETRLRDQSSPAGGGALRFAARLPSLGVRTGFQLDLLAQRFADRTEGSARLYAFADRPTWLGPYVQLRPGLIAGLRWQSLDPERVAAASTELEPHPRIYQRYIYDHPILLAPELELRVYPFSDMALWTGAQMIPNSDMRSLDHLNIDIGTTGIARRPRPWVPTWALSYQISPRFADANRQTAFIRHRIASELGLGVWARDHARVLFGLGHQLFVSNVAPVRNLFELWLRIDASFGRRLRDYGPRELWFQEPWAPRAWGTEQTQAASTTALRLR